MRANVYKPINNARVMAAFYNGSTTEQNAILKWLRTPPYTPYYPPMINTRDLSEFDVGLSTPVQPGEVIVRNMDTGELSVVPRENFFEQYTYADHIVDGVNVNYVNLKGEVST